MAACNPHRGNSVLSEMDRDSIKSKDWFRSSYHVRSLPPTLELLKWDYGALEESDELEYIRKKFEIEKSNISNLNVTFLSEQIARAQSLLRKYAVQHLLQCDLSEFEADISCKSTVSQRDIQRVFTLYSWFMMLFKKFSRHGEGCPFNQDVRALFVAIGIIYYFRLNETYRKMFVSEMFVNRPVGELGVPVSFEVALKDEIDWFIEELVVLPERIAPTEALKENIFAITVCTMTCIPLIIVGPPGSSKTLSFKIVSTNIQGQQSKSEKFKVEEVFPSLYVHPYQCSRRSTSKEVEKVFERAIQRQKSLEAVGTRCQCVVMMDEAGLPQDSHESLKVLHYYLDKPRVSTNHHTSFLFFSPPPPLSLSLSLSLSPSSPIYSRSSFSKYICRLLLSPLATLCWMRLKPIVLSASFVLKQLTVTCKCWPIVVWKYLTKIPRPRIW